MEIEVRQDGYDSSFVWSNKQSRLVYDFQDSSESPFRKSQEALLIRWQPEEAIPLLKNVLDNAEPDSDNSYSMYLLGLAYELSGDSNNAVRTYWELWQKYPVSVYARLAQAKVELTKH